MTRIETVLIVNKNKRYLFGFKNPNKKFGGRWNGFGGGLEEEESLEQCAIRETRDETGITPKGLEKLGIILFKFKTDEQDHKVYFYKASDYDGDLKVTKDFIKYMEFSPRELEAIYDNMMPADKHWLPFFTKNKLFKGKVTLDRVNSEFEVVSYEINEVHSLN